MREQVVTNGTLCLVEADEFTKIYDPSVGEKEQWYINDHCFIRGNDGHWHMFGITHAEPLNPLDEKHLAHATSKELTAAPWTKRPFALSADLERWNEFHLWAPCVVEHEGLYYMYYCAGDESSHTYKIHLATSTDLVNWERHPENPMVVAGFDGRDPFVMRAGGQWIMYYTATSRPEGGNHIVAAQTSDDLIHWNSPVVTFLDDEVGTSGGSTESPFVVRRGKWYYLFICNNDRRGGYDATDVYRSLDPLHWNMEDRVGTIAGHACEVIRDLDGRWYVSRCGWGRGGLYLAPLYWYDDMDEKDCSM